MAKKVLIDLDVVTTAFWNGNTEAMKFLEEVKKEDFEIYVPYILLELLSEWRYEELRDRILDFYKLNAKRIISVKEIVEKSREMDVDYRDIITQLEEHGVKDEDAILIVVTSIFELDCLFTFNRKHLRDKKDVINEVLKENGVKKIEIRVPTT